MPSVEDIEAFKPQINKIGGSDETGLSDIVPSENKLSDDLSSLLEGISTDEELADFPLPEEENPPEEPGVGPDSDEGSGENVFSEPYSEKDDKISGIPDDLSALLSGIGDDFSEGKSVQDEGVSDDDDAALPDEAEEGSDFDVPGFTEERGSDFADVPGSEEPSDIAEAEEELKDISGLADVDDLSEADGGDSAEDGIIEKISPDDEKEEPYDASESAEKDFDDIFELPENVQDAQVIEGKYDPAKTEEEEDKKDGLTDIFSEDPVKKEDLSFDDAEDEDKLDLPIESLVPSGIFPEYGAVEEEDHKEEPDVQPDSGDENFDIGKLDKLEDLNEGEKEEIFSQKAEGEETLPPEGSEELKSEERSEKSEKVSETEEAEKFSMSDFGSDFAEEAAGSKKAGSEKEEQDIKSYEGSFKLSRDDFYKISSYLGTLPKNLKFIIEDLIGNKNLTGEKLDSLIDFIKESPSPRQLANFVSKITLKRIKIPAIYEKKFAENLEAEQGSFSYILKHKILPMTAKMTACFFGIVFLFFTVKTFVWDPLYSLKLYNRGFALLQDDNYPGSEKLFLKASGIHPVKKQFYRYAEGYIGKREYREAEKKYVQMLGLSLGSEREKADSGAKGWEKGFFQKDKKGFIDYSKLKTFYQGDYARADKILSEYLTFRGNKWDYDVLLRKFDNFINWAESDPSKFIDAEGTINDMVFKFGDKNEIFFRNIALHLRNGKILKHDEKLADLEGRIKVSEKRVGDLEDKIRALENLRQASQSSRSEKSGDDTQIAELRKSRTEELEKLSSLKNSKKHYSAESDYFLENCESYIEETRPGRLDAYIAAEFYSYDLEKRIYGSDEDEFLKVIKADSRNIEAYFLLAYYYNKTYQNRREEAVYRDIERHLNEYGLDESYLIEKYPHSFVRAKRERRRISILSLNRIGELLCEKSDIMGAQKYFQNAVKQYEENKQLVGMEPCFGKIYENLGNIYYDHAGRLDSALVQFDLAEQNRYTNDNLQYKIGYIYYKNNDFSRSLDRFYYLSGKIPDNEMVLMGTANSAFYRKTYSTAAAYYNLLIEKLEYRRSLQDYIDIGQSSDQRKMMSMLMQSYNNLGLTYFKLAENSRSRELYSKALVDLAKSAEIYDLMNRYPQTMTPPSGSSFAQLNMRLVLTNPRWNEVDVPSYMIMYKNEREIETKSNGGNLFYFYGDLDRDILRTFEN